jgi:hypothetical protein
VAAAEALGRIGDPASRPALEQALRRATAIPVGISAGGAARTPYPTVSRDARGRRTVSFRGPQPPAAGAATGVTLGPDPTALERAVRAALESLGR